MLTKTDKIISYLGLALIGLLLHASVTQAEPTESLNMANPIIDPTASFWTANSDAIPFLRGDMKYTLIRPNTRVLKNDSKTALPFSHEQPDHELELSRSLPAVPASIFMALFGFFCVSLVKDRRFWMFLITGLIGFSLAGINTLPRWAARLSQRNLNNHQAQTAPYIYSSLNNFSLKQNKRNYNHSLKFISANDTTSPKAITTHPDTQTPKTIFSVKPTEFLVYFTPAYIHLRQPRGPPLSA